MAEKVLLVDDEANFLEVLSERMTTRGMKVSTSTTAEEALQALEKESFDAVVLDLRMPGMDGLQALKIMKDRYPDLQVIMLTGYGTVESGIEAMKHGALDFVEKPLDIKSLTEKIKEAKARRMVLVEKKNAQAITEIMSTKAW